MMASVYYQKKALKQIQTAPKHVVEKLNFWVRTVIEGKINELQLYPSWNDEPLKGKRSGQRSIRLNKQWRAIYSIEKTHIHIITIEEVTPHDYRTKQ